MYFSETTPNHTGLLEDNSAERLHNLNTFDFCCLCFAAASHIDLTMSKSVIKVLLVGLLFLLHLLPGKENYEVFIASQKCDINTFKMLAQEELIAKKNMTKILIISLGKQS